MTDKEITVYDREEMLMNAVAILKGTHVKSICKFGYIAYFSVLLLHNALAEMPEVVVSPETNTVNHCEFHVQLDNGRTLTNSCTVLIFISAKQHIELPNSIYVELRNENNYCASFISCPLKQTAVPRKYSGNMKNGVCFWFEVDRSLLKRSWASVQLQERMYHPQISDCEQGINCVIQFLDWCKAE